MRLGTLSVTALFIFVCTTTRADDKEVEKAILTRFEAVVQAMPTGDASAVTKAAGQEFRFTDVFGRSGPADQWAERAKVVLSPVKSPVLTAQVQSVTVKGETAQAFLRAKIAGTATDRQGQEGPLDMTVVYRTEWVKEGEAWKMKSAREVMFDGTTNKKPLVVPLSTAEEEVRKEFQVLYAAVTETYEKQDWAAVEKGIPDDFSAHDAEGTPLTKKELIERVKAGAKVVSNPLATLLPQQLILDGDKVIVIRVMRLIGNVNVPGGQTGRLVYKQVARDTFVRAGKAYNPKSSDELYAEATVKGVPVPLPSISGR